MTRSALLRTAIFLAILLTALLTIAPVHAQESVAVSFEVDGECPSVGELLDALGDGFGIEGDRPLAVHLVADAAGHRLSVEAPTHPAVERAIPDADCATLARLIAIIVRGYVRDLPSAPAPPPPPTTPSAPRFLFGGASLGAAFELEPLNVALALQLEGGLGLDAFRARLVVTGTTVTGIGQANFAVDRLALLIRADVGATATLSPDLEISGLIGLGIVTALVRDLAANLEIVRAAPSLGASVLLDVRLIDALWFRAELGGDAPLIHDVYVAAPGVIPDGMVDRLAPAPFAWLRALIGLTVRGDV